MDAGRCGYTMTGQGNLSHLSTSLIDLAGSVAGWESVWVGIVVRVLRSTTDVEDGANVTSYDIGARFSRLEARRGCMWRTSGRLGLANETWCWGPVCGFDCQVLLFFRTGRGSECAAALGVG